MQGAVYQRDAAMDRLRQLDPDGVELGRARVRQQTVADGARSAAETIEENPPAEAEADSAERWQARSGDLRRDRRADPIPGDPTSTDADDDDKELRVAQQPTVTTAAAG